MRTPNGRRGFTLVELLVGVVIMAVMGAALVRLMIFDTRFADDREAWRTARQAARSGLAVLTSDLRMVETGGGVEAAAASGQDITFRVPYAMGVLCATTGATSTVALLPVDSLMFAQPGHSGFAWRHQTSGVYTYVAGGTLTLGAAAATCTAAGITLLPGSRVVTFTGVVPPTLSPTTVFLAYRRIRYEIKASTTMPGEMALWRTAISTGAAEELAAPFAATARFRFYVGVATTAQDAVPAPLSTISGLELAFTSQSDRTPRQSAGRKVVPFQTSIFFQNTSN